MVHPLGSGGKARVSLSEGCSNACLGLSSHVCLRLVRSTGCIPIEDERLPVNQRIRFKGPRREWHATRAAAPVSLAPEQVEVRKDIDGEGATATEALAVRHDPANWRSSSYDLMSGLQITEFEDTVPGALLDDLGL